MKTSFPLLTDKELSQLENSLLYMKMGQLKQVCIRLALPAQGKKTELINRIVEFVQTGRIVRPGIMPTASLAKNYPLQELNAASLMLYGSYKNDALTRAFFTSLIGPHFHFTAYGIDWLNQRWHEGNPPTYQEFANYWVDETEQRKNKKAAPKQEWAFIRFLQKMATEQPTMQQADLMSSWKALQDEKVLEVDALIKKALHKSAAH